MCVLPAPQCKAGQGSPAPALGRALDTVTVTVTCVTRPDPATLVFCALREGSDSGGSTCPSDLSMIGNKFSKTNNLNPIFVMHPTLKSLILAGTSSVPWI